MCCFQLRMEMHTKTSHTYQRVGGRWLKGLYSIVKRKGDGSLCALQLNSPTVQKSSSSATSRLSANECVLASHPFMCPSMCITIPIFFGCMQRSLERNVFELTVALLHRRLQSYRWASSENTSIWFRRFPQLCCRRGPLPSWNINWSEAKANVFCQIRHLV